jgi:hypothetical protein
VGEARLAEKYNELARAAAHNPVRFFEHVLRDEKTQLPVSVPPHQRVLLDFVLHHRRSVTMLPVGHTKTVSAAGLALIRMGKDPMSRGAIISATEAQAQKVLLSIRNYCDTSMALHSVFPHLRRSRREGDPWTQTAITIERPPGIRDASVVAYGFDSPRILGSRLDWVVCDDLLNDENTRTKDARDRVFELFDMNVLSRVEPRTGWVQVCNTVWHPNDLVHRLEEMGWATLRMDVLGNIIVRDDVLELEAGRPAWDSPELRPATPNPDDPVCRLARHDPDPRNEVMLWPERFGPSEWAEVCRTSLPVHRNRKYLNVARDDETSMCKREYVDACFDAARKLGVTGFVERYEGQNPTFTGVDLAVSPEDESDDVALFTFEARPSGHRVILDIEFGKWSGPVIVDKLFEKRARYNSTLRVENNGCQQFLLQFALERNVALPIRPHTTGRAKAHPEHGIPGIFVEMANAAWAFPVGKHGEVHPAMQRLANECLYYVPSKHSGDVLMACQPAGQLVTTRRGLVPIEQVIEGDEVLTHKGRFRKVTGTTRRPYSGDLVELRPRGGFPVRMTGNHPVWRARARIETETRSNRVVPSKWGFVPADELRCGPKQYGDFVEVPVLPEGDGLTIDLAAYVVAPSQGWGARWYVTKKHVRWSGNTNTRLSRFQRISGDAAMLLGLYLAEGSIGGNKHVVSFGLHRREVHLVSFLNRAMGSLFGVKARVRKGSGTNGISVDFGSKIAARVFAELGKREHKAIPWSWWTAMRAEDRLAVARGWAMGDGFYVEGSGVGVLQGTSISRPLLAQVADAFRHAGYLPSMGAFMRAGPRLFAGKPSSCRNSWKVSLTQMDTRSFFSRCRTEVEAAHWRSGGTADQRLGFQGRTNSSSQRLPTGGVATKIATIERVPFEGLVFNLHVEEDESYVVESIAVHNCYFAWAQAREWGILSTPTDEKRDGGGSMGMALMAR